MCAITIVGTVLKRSTGLLVQLKIKVVIKLVFSVFLYFSASAEVPFIVIDHMEREIGLSKKISSRSRKAELHDYLQTKTI